MSVKFFDTNKNLNFYNSAINYNLVWSAAGAQLVTTELPLYISVLSTICRVGPTTQPTRCSVSLALRWICGRLFQNDSGDDVTSANLHPR